MSGHTTVSAFKEKLDMEHIMKQIAKCIVMFPVYILHFYTPVKDGLYYVVPFVRPSVHPSVRQSVNFSCPLLNSDTVKDIFMKLGTNINHHQTMCREQESTLHLHFFTELWGFEVFGMKIVSALLL